MTMKIAKNQLDRASCIHPTHIVRARKCKYIYIYFFFKSVIFFYLAKVKALKDDRAGRRTDVTHHQNPPFFVRLLIIASPSLSDCLVLGELCGVDKKAGKWKEVGCHITRKWERGEKSLATTDDEREREREEKHLVLVHLLTLKIK